MTLNKMLPKGFKLIAENDIGKPLFKDFALPKIPIPQFSQPKADVMIKGERATSRQIAMKEKEALKRQESIQFPGYSTPSKKQKKTIADNPQ